MYEIGIRETLGYAWYRKIIAGVSLTSGLFITEIRTFLACYEIKRFARW